MQTRAVLVGLIGSAIRALSDRGGSSRCFQQLGLRVNATYATIACFPEFPGRNRELGIVYSTRFREYGGMTNDMNPANEHMERRLAMHPFFRGMSPHHIKLLAQSATPTQFDAGQVIFRAGEPANGFYLIETGHVALEGWVREHGPI